MTRHISRYTVAAVFAAFVFLFPIRSFAQDAIDQWNAIAVDEAAAGRCCAVERQRLAERLEGEGKTVMLVGVNGQKLAGIPLTTQEVKTYGETVIQRRRRRGHRRNDKPFSNGLPARISRVGPGRSWWCLDEGTSSRRGTPR